jgi:hypothetical protein
MTSQLNVDTIVDKAGSGGTNVKIANTSVTVAEGGSGTTNTVQGLIKSWTHADCTGTVGIEDSLNTSSLTEHANGVIQFTRVNNMANVNYVAVMCSEIPSNAADNAHRLHDLNTTHYLQSYYQAGATADVDPFVTMMTGDLA